MLNSTSRSIDFKITINGSHVFNVNFKFNAETVSNLPQFVSLHCTSDFMILCYVQFFYSSYLQDLCDFIKTKKPNYKEYNKSIRSYAPKCVEKLQTAYYQGCKASSKYSGRPSCIKFYQLAKCLAKQSIIQFLKIAEPNADNIKNYLTVSQQKKVYMLYKDGEIYEQRITLDDIVPISYHKVPSKQYFIGISKTGKRIAFLLR